MKCLTVAALALIVSGCDSTGTSDYSLYFQALRQSFAAGLRTPTRISKAQAAAIPYASMGYRVNDAPEQLLVLATDTGEERLWTSGQHVVLVTRNGQIVRTVGLTHDLTSLVPGQNSLMSISTQGTHQHIRSVRLEDFADLGIYGATVSCISSAQGRQTIVILGRGITTEKVDEACRSEILNWSFTNSYWIDPKTRMVWRSIQHVSPTGEKVETQLLRPPG